MSKKKPSRRKEAEIENGRAMTSSPSRRITAVRASFTGPLPPPQVLAQYNEIAPDGANRIITMAEEQSKHRMALEKSVVASEIKRADRGLYAGVGITLAFLVASVFITIQGYPWAGAIIGTVDIVSLAGVFVYGTKSRREERKERINTLAAEP